MVRCRDGSGRMTLKKTNKTMFSTSFRDDEMSAVQENDLNHLLDIYTAIKQQVLLRRALSENKRDEVEE